MFAPIMVVIPFFILAKKIGIENTHLALVLSLYLLLPALHPLDDASFFHDDPP